MRRIYFLTILLICFSTNAQSYENVPTHNWCGIYSHDGVRGYMRIARNDLSTGSRGCTTDAYNENAADNGTVTIPVEVTKKRSDVHKWQQFHNHLIEVRAKLHNGTMEKLRFVRDIEIR